MYLPPEHPIMSFETIEIKMAAVSPKRSMEGVASSRLPDSWENENNCVPRPKPPLIFRTHFFLFPYYLGAWNRLWREKSRAAFLFGFNAVIQP